MRSRLLLFVSLLALVGADKTVVKVINPESPQPYDSCDELCNCTAATTMRYRLTCEFMLQNPDIDVQLELAGWGDLHRRAEEAALSPDPALHGDIVYVGNTWMIDFKERNVLTNLQPFLNDLRLERSRGDLTLEFARQCDFDMKFEGDFWAIPVELDTRPLYYRKDLYKHYLNHTNPPATLQEMWDNAVIIQKGERAAGREMYGYVTDISFNILQHFVPFYLSFGGSLVNSTGGCGLRTPEFKRAVEMMYSMYSDPQNAIMPDWITSLDEAHDLFSNRKAVHVITGHWMWGAFKELVSPLDNTSPAVGVGMVPAGPKGRFAFFGSTGWGITSKSKHPDKAWRYLRWLEDPDGSHLVGVKKVGFLSAYQRLWPYANKEPQVQVMTEQLPYAFSQYFPTTGVKYLPKLEQNQTVGKMLRRVLNGTSINESAELACAEFDALFCCEAVIEPIVMKEFPIYIFPILAGVVIIAIIGFVLWWTKHKKLTVMQVTVLVSQKVASSLAHYEVEEAEAVVREEGAALPDQLKVSFARLLANLKAYKPYLPHSCLMQLHDRTELFVPSPTNRASRRPTNAVSDSTSLSGTQSGLICDARGQSALVSTQSGRGSLLTPLSEGSHSSSKLASSTVKAIVRKTRVSLVESNIVGYLKAHPDPSGVVHTDWMASDVEQWAVSVIDGRGLVQTVSGDRRSASFNARSPCGGHASAAVAVAFGRGSDTEVVSNGVVTGQAVCGDFGSTSMLRFMVLGKAVCSLYPLERIAAKWRTKALADGEAYSSACYTWDGELKGAVLMAKRGDRPVRLYNMTTRREKKAGEKPEEWMYQLENIGEGEHAE
eukprot:Hpha_TRINITY_DN15716_c2_g1::TRINITY_DN15716_c2_g1_i2::g.37697::m.37697